MAKRSEGRVALITGGARGIGAATAERLAEDGAAIAIADLDGAGAEATAKEIAASHKVPAIGLKCDVSQAAEVDRTVTQIAERLGSLDILVNNAGITRDNLIHKMSDEDWDLVVAVHLRGAFLCSRAAQREMVKGNWGRIINLSSVSALGNRGQANYSTAKAGLQGMARTLAIELGRYGVTANAIAPGFIDTEMSRGVPEDVARQFLEQVPAGRYGKVDEVVFPVLFLCSRYAEYITGQVIHVSGGFYMG